MARRDYGERELALVEQVLRSGRLCALEGNVTHEFEALFARMIGSKHAVAMNSAMSVLHTSVMCSGAGPGYEVVCDPVFVFGSMAALYAGARPRYVDVNPDTHAMDADKLEAAISDRTRAVIVTHPWGLPAEIDRIVDIAHRHNLMVIEDCAHAVLATHKGKYAGSWGDIGSFSFQGSKQMSLGDGGMATTDSEEIAASLALHAGAPTFYSVAHGLHFNFRMNEITAAVGIAQIEKLPKLVADLKANAAHYDAAIMDCKWLRPQAPPGGGSTYHLWAANFRGEEHGISLEDFRAALGRAGSALSMGYTGMPAYKHPVIRDRMAHAFHCPQVKEKVDYPDGLCPNAEMAIPRILLAYTLQPEDDAKREAEKLHAVVSELEK